MRALSPESITACSGWALKASGTGASRINGPLPAPTWAPGPGRLDQAMQAFAEAYADQNEQDHRALSDAVAAGRIAVVSSV